MIIKKIIALILIYQLGILSAFAADAPANAQSNQNEFNLQEITLPSEVKDMNKAQGSIYYSNSVKNKVLIPVHIWGEIKQSGLHFIPADTTFVKGLSLAGGPTSNANLEDVVLIRNSTKGKSQEIDFDLSEGGDQNAHQFKIEAGDTIFVKRDTFSENRAYYTSLIGIFITVLTTFVIVNKVE